MWTEVIVADSLECQLALHCHSPTGNVPERPPASVTWPLGLCGFDIVSVTWCIVKHSGAHALRQAAESRIARHYRLHW